MTPLHLEIMLHYNSRVVAYGDADNNHTAPAVSNYTIHLCNKGLLHRKLPPFEGPEYEITDKGRAYVKFLTEMPLPVSVWHLTQ